MIMPIENDPLQNPKRTESGLTTMQEQRLIGRMIRHRRWKVTKAAKELAMTATLCGMDDDSPSVRNVAVGNLIRMEAQNQDDEHAVFAAAKPTLGSNVTNQQINIYLPSNGREAIEQTNGYEHNGQH